MLEKISLLPKAEIIWKKEVRKRRLIQIGSLLALVFYFFLLSSFFSYVFLLKRNFNSQEKRITTLKGEIKNLGRVESQRVLLKTKLQRLSKIFQEEDVTSQIWAKLDDWRREGISYTKTSFKEGKVLVNGEARDVLVLDEFIREVVEEEKKLFSQAQLETMTKTPEGDYTFTLALFQ